MTEFDDLDRNPGQSLQVLQQLEAWIDFQAPEAFHLKTVKPPDQHCPHPSLHVENDFVICDVCSSRLFRWNPSQLTQALRNPISSLSPSQLKTVWSGGSPISHSKPQDSI